MARASTLSSALSFKQLHAFITVAQSTNFAEAAIKMHLSQPALSSAIKKCETILGGALFIRTTRKVSLTREGEAFLPIALRLANEYHDSVNQIQAIFTKQTGSLTIASMPSFAERYLPQYMYQFHTDYPNITIKIEDVVVEKVVELVQQGKVECGFSFEPDSPNELSFEPLFTDTFNLVCHPEHPLVKTIYPLQEHKQQATMPPTSLKLQSILEYPMLVMNRQSNLRVFIDSVYHTYGFTQNIVAEATQIGTLGQCVKHDIGIAILPTLATRRMQELGLVCIALDEPLLHRKVGIIYDPYQAMSVTTQSFLDIVRSHNSQDTV